LQPPFSGMATVGLLFRPNSVQMLSVAKSWITARPEVDFGVAWSEFCRSDKKGWLGRSMARLSLINAVPLPDALQARSSVPDDECANTRPNVHAERQRSPTSVAAATPHSSLHRDFATVIRALPPNCCHKIKMNRVKMPVRRIPIRNGRRAINLARGTFQSACDRCLAPVFYTAFFYFFLAQY
jgi:hypothetical protein